MSDSSRFIAFVLCIALAVVFASVGAMRIEKGDR
jgi:hypothetical protein